MVDYHHSHNTAFAATLPLNQCFGKKWEEKDSLKFFKHYLAGMKMDYAGRPIEIDAGHGMKFMYKEKGTGRHIIHHDNYLSHRGRRLPWILHTMQKTRNVYTRVVGSRKRGKQEREIMYVGKYDSPKPGNSDRQHLVVIAKKLTSRNDLPYSLRTAFPVFGYNELLKRLERYEPISAIKGV